VTALENGYSNEDIETLLRHAREDQKPFSFVPAVTVTGAEIENAEAQYNKYLLAPLKKQDPMALAAGLKTRCCQHLTGAGGESALHAYGSIYGATYRLALKTNPNQADWAAQAWTVLSEDGAILLFDSIEYSAGISEKMVLAFFKKAAEKLLINHLHLQEIWIGASQYARLKLDKHGYMIKPTPEAFSIAGHAEGSYTDADSIVVLMSRSQLSLNMDNMKPTGVRGSSAANSGSEYRLCYGVDTYLKPGKIVKTLALSKEARQFLQTEYAPVVNLLMENRLNPLVEEGFVSSDDKQEHRYREGECFITDKAAKLWVDNTLNPRIKELGLTHHVYVETPEENVLALLQKAQKNTAIKTFSIIPFLGIHAVSIFVDPVNKVSFILDSEPGSGLESLKMACQNSFPGMRVITPGLAEAEEGDLRLQKDYYSCVTFALKSVRYYAKYADDFSRILREHVTETDVLMLNKMPAVLLKMAQIPLKFTKEQEETVVSKKRNLNLVQYMTQHELRIDNSTFNTSALKTRQQMIRQMMQK
jgi:hypothetical protein